MELPQAPQVLLLDVATRLAIERTRVAYERTIMAAIRTATSLITFGFSAYKFFSLDIAQNTTTTHLIGPRQFGIAMIVLGLASLLLGWLEYRRDIAKLRVDYPQLENSSVGIVASLVTVLGGVLLVVALLNG
jgi:putative membrane protein